MHWRRGISLDHQLRGQVAKAVQNPMVASRHLPTELEASDSNLSIHLITYPAYLLTNSSKRKPPAAALRAQVPRVTRGKLTDDDLKKLEGNRDQLAGRAQERYGIAKEEAERQVRDFQNKYTDLYK